MLKLVSKPKSFLTFILSLGLALGSNALPSQAATTTVNITVDSLYHSVGSAVAPTLTATVSAANGVDLTCNVYGNSDSSYVTPLDMTSLSAGTYKIHCAAVARATFTVGTNTDGVLTVVAAAPFTCDASFYQISNGSFFKLNAASSFQYSAIVGANSVSSLNSLAWNPEDNYLYAVASNKLYKFNSSLVSIPAPASGSTGVGLNIYTNIAGASASNSPTHTSTQATAINTGGDFLKIGNSYYLIGGSSAGFSITDVRARSVVRTVTPSASWAAYDVTWIGSTGWGIQNGASTSTLYKAVLGGTSTADATFTVTSKNLSAFVGSASENFGAAFSDSDGNAYFFGNSSKNLYQITKAELLKDSPTATLVTNAGASGASSPSDGASCPAAVSPTAATLTTTTPATSITSSSASVAGTVTTPNLPGADVPASGLKFCYATSSLLLQSSPTCVDASPSTIAKNTTSPAALTASLTGLTAGTTYFFQTKATNSASSSSYGEVRTFTTLSTWTLTANSATYTIGGSVPSLSATASPSAGLSGSATCRAYTSADTGYATPLTINASLAAGTYVVHCTGTTAAGYSLASNSNGTLTVTSLLGWTITGTSNTYQTPGTAPAAAGSASPSAGLSGSLSCAYYATTDTSHSSPVTINSSTVPGTYAVHCTGTSASGYAAPANNDGVLTVTASPWYLNANDATYTIGGTLPTLSASALPAAGLSGSASCSVYANSDTFFRTALTLDATLPGGTYVIRCTGSSTTGYAAPTINTGVLTVTSLTAWTLTAGTASYTQGGSVPSIAGTANPVGGLSGSATCRVYANSDSSYSTALTVNASLAPGTYVTRCTGAAAAGYAAATSANGVLTVSAAAATYTVTYSGNQNSSGQAPTDANAYNAGATVTVKANTGTLVRTGYNFAGWNTASDGSGTPYSATGSDSFNLGSANKTLYAVWNLKTFAITYASNDGLSHTDSQTYYYGDITALDYQSPWTRAGYTFLGWSTDPSVTSPDGSYMVTSTGTLYAVWEQNVAVNYTITYYKNDNTATAQNEIYADQDPTALSYANPWSRSGYNFLGWSTDPNASAPGSSFTVTANASLYAVWQLIPANSYTINYYKNDGTLTHQGVVYQDQDVTALSYNNPWSLTGYTFQGWSTDPSATTPDSAFTVTANASLYAVWLLNAYTVSYYKNDGSLTQIDETLNYGDSGALNYSNPWTRTGYTFQGWSTDPNATSPDSSFTVSGDSSLYAVWLLNEYSITFVANDGSGSTQDAGYDYGDTTALNFANPWARTGYTFLGWSTSSTASQADSSYTVSGDASLYAVWKIDVYTITYDANDGSGSTVDEQYSYGHTNVLSYSNPFSRSGYNFLGWSTDPNATAADSSFTATANASLYAVWQLIPANSYTINYYKNDGTLTHQGVVYQDQDVTALSYNNPWSLTGYTFLGWATTSGASAPDSSYVVTANGSLYAVWQLNTYTITYDKNDGSSTTVDRTLNYNVTTALNYSNPWSRTGYTFLGWSIDPSAAVADTSFVVTEDATLYAVWQIKSYTVTFAKNDGSGATTAGSYNHFSTDPLSFSNPWSRTGYTFLGWATTSGATASANSYAVTGAVTLYAVWQINSYTITYDKNDESSTTVDRTLNYNVTTALAYANPWSRTGYTFLGWSTDPEATVAATTYVVVADGTLYAVWQLKSYTITFAKNDGGATTATASYNHFATNALSYSNPWSRTGYTFLGWATTSGASAAATSYTVSGTVTLYAVWQINSYTITFAKNDGGDTTATASYNHFATNALSYSNPWSRTGYTFLGWATTRGASAAATSYTVSGTVTLFAVWRINSYVITFAKNDNSGTVTTASYNYGATNALSIANPWTRTGYTFLGWATLSSATVADSSYTVSGVVTLYAVWQGATYTITYSKNDGSGTTATSTYAFGATNALTYNNPWTRSNYNFIGWGTAASATANVTTYNVTKNATLYAVWKVVTYQITFSKNDGSSTVTTKRYNAGATNALTLANPWTRTGYTFLGWATTSEATVASTGYSVTGAATVYAVWKLNSYKVIYSKNDGSGTIASNNFNHGANDALDFANPWTRTGITFLGWSTNATATTALTSYSVTAPVTLYAVWKGNGGTISKSVFFYGDSSIVTSTAMAVLDDLKNQLKGKRNITISVSGWVKETNDKSYDARLSADRAAAIVRVMKDGYGISATYSYKGYGISPENSDKARRAEIVITWSN